MRMRVTRTSLRQSGAILLLILCGAVPLKSQADGGPNQFGFTGPEIFPIDNGIGHLRAADLNGNGLTDLVIVNNARSKINLLYNQTGADLEMDVKPVRHELNELPFDARFRLDSISSEKRISSMVLADLNSNGRPDIAYYGEPKELVVHYNEGTNGWSAPKRWPLTDGLLNPNALVHGDLNGDGRMDLLLLAERHFYFLAQNEGHQFSEPQRIPYSGAVQALQVVDLQGDGRDDLLLINWDSPNPLRFRLQNESGHLGPEVHFTLPQIRSYWADDLDGNGQAEVITIAQKSGRAQVSHFTQRAAEILSHTWEEGQFQILPLTRTDKARRGMIWADINGDERSDLLVAEPESGQLTVYLQNEEGSLAPPKTFATLTGVSELVVGDWTGDGRAEIFLLSMDERQIGVTRLDENGRIPFPKTIPLGGRPLAMAVGPLTENGNPVLAVILDRDGKRELVLRDAEKVIKRQPLNETFRSNPSALAIHDVNQDGRPDLLVLIPYERIKVLLHQNELEFEELDVAPPGGIIDQPWFSTADVDGNGQEELLLPQRNFLRAVILQSEPANEDSETQMPWSFIVKEQINGSESNSRIVGAAALKSADKEHPSLFLLDAERRFLTLSERDENGIWQVVRNMPLPIMGFNSLQAAAIGGTNPNSIAFFGINTAAWLDLHGSVWEFTALDSYETSVRDGHLTDVISGDLNQNGRKDLVFLETGRSHIDIVAFDPPHTLRPAQRWQVFEERSFRPRRADSPEPREALVADVTGDGKKDLLVLVHDRILLYPQE
jgi:hypothetical protein